MRRPYELSTAIMCHPTRLASAGRVVRECLPLRARIVEDPEPDGCPSPLRTAKTAWAAIAPGATHHLVLQDDVHLAPGFAGHVARLVERHPGSAVSLGVLWVSPYNSYRVRQAAVGGFSAVRLAPWEWVPTLGLVLPAATARELAEFLRAFPDATRDDDEHIAVFCAERGIPVVAPVPHLLDHGTQPSVAGNDHHGVRHGVARVDSPFGTGHWDGPVLEDPAHHGGLGYAVELVASRCNVRVRRRGAQEAAEQPFTWPWRPWSGLLGVAEETIADAAGAAGPPPDPLPGELAGEVWAAGFLLGALSRDGGERRPAHRAVREAAGAESLRSWITAGLRPDDLSGLGEDGCAAAVEWTGRALAAGRHHAAPGTVNGGTVAPTTAVAHTGTDPAPAGSTAPTAVTAPSPDADPDTGTHPFASTAPGQRTHPGTGPAPTGVTGSNAVTNPARDTGPAATTAPGASKGLHRGTAPRGAPHPGPDPAARTRAVLDRMAHREARHLLRTAPEELPDVRLEIRHCPEHHGAAPDAARVSRDLPARWLAEHLSEFSGSTTLVVLACERLEPRPLAGLADLIGGGWKGVVETRAATAARLRAGGLSGEALLSELDAAEVRFEAGGGDGDGDGATVTLPAACRAGGGESHWLSPHAEPEHRAGDGLYARLRLRYVRDIAL